MRLNDNIITLLKTIIQYDFLISLIYDTFLF